MGNYVIKQGDTLSEIAKANGTTVETLAKLNNIQNVNLIRAGSTLKLPTIGNKAIASGAVATGVTSNKSNTNNSNSYPAFNYQQSDAVNKAYDALNTHLGTKPTQTEFQYNEQLNTVINDILNGKKFSYDLNGDALYQQYKDKYIQQGKMAMADTMGQAAAMTGGYGNSYAQSVGQQAYQAQLQNLNDIVPQLWQMAYDRYNDEKQDLYNQYGMLSALDDKHYNRQQDELANWMTERGYLQDVANSERTFDYGVQSDKWSSGYDIHRDAIEDALKREEIEYEKARDAIEDERWQKEFDALYGNKATETRDSAAVTGASLGAAVAKSVKTPTKEPVKVEAEKDTPSYDEIEDDLNAIIASGASKSEINNYLREALRAGYISQSEYQKLKDLYAPRGNTY